ncbi:GDP-L-fucose synthase [subsurface metagenome]
MGKVFVTGATRLVGSQIVECLVTNLPFGLSSAKDIICLVRTEGNAHFLSELGVTKVIGDITKPESLKDIFSRYPIEYVFHLAANVNLYSNYENLYRPNVEGTTNLIEEFLQSTATTFMYASSISVYDGYLTARAGTVFDEETPLGTTDLKKGEKYSITKRIAESKISDYQAENLDKTFIIARLGAAIGPRDRLIIPAFVKIMPVKVPKLIGNGNVHFAATSTLDIARAWIFLAKKGHAIAGEVFNISGRPDKLSDFYGHFTEYYHRKPFKFSIPKWLFRLFRPLLRLISKIFKKSALIQTIFSEDALNFIDKNYVFPTNKLESIGFEFKSSAGEAINLGLQLMDPERTLVKPNA